MMDACERWMFVIFVGVLAAWGIDAVSVSMTGEDPLATGLLRGLLRIGETMRWIIEEVVSA